MHLKKRGFTIIELVVVLSILAILSGVLVPRMKNYMRAEKDAKRLADIKRIRNAVEQYHMDRGEYPAPNPNSNFGGWEVSSDGTFLRELVDTGYLDESLTDPVNDSTYHYRYFVYEAGSYSCQGGSKYYVLGVRNFESSDFAKRNKGFFKCAGRNWGNEFAYVTGGGATYK